VNSPPALNADVVTPVTRPFALTVMLGIEVEEPKVPTSVLTVARVVVVLTEVTSPVKLGIFVVLVAVPVRLPTNPPEEVMMPLKFPDVAVIIPTEISGVPVSP